MKDSFNEIYLHMFFEESGKINFDIGKFKNFIETSIKFKDNNVISEDKMLLIDIPDKLLNYCYDHQNEIIEFNKVKEFCKESKHYQNIKNVKGKNLYFTIFDFSNKHEIKKFIFNIFKIEPEDIEVFNEAFKYFEERCSKLDGFYNTYNEIAICIINEKSSNIIETLYHELSHYIQDMCNIRITNDFKFDENKLENNEKFKKLKELGITYNDLNYYFSGDEFNVHIDELIMGLWKTYIKFYITEFEHIFQFLIMVRHEILTDNNFINSNLMLNYMITNGNNSAPLVMFAASCYFNHKYQKIDEIVRKVLTQKFNEWKERKNL